MGGNFAFAKRGLVGVAGDYSGGCGRLGVGSVRFAVVIVIVIVSSRW